ncbi:hypothetical protein [Actinophytocola sediminis]
MVTPESAISPMDAASTLQIPRTVVAANDERHNDPDATMVVPGSVARGRPEVPTAELPAIAQEALTDVVSAPPGIRSRQRRLEDAERARQAATQRQPMPSPVPHQHPHPPQAEELDGLIPTTKQPPPTTRSTLSQRLDG